MTDEMKPARPEDIPIATHSGVWDFQGMKLKVHRLDDGRSVIDADDFEMVVKWLDGGTGALGELLKKLQNPDIE